MRVEIVDNTEVFNSLRRDWDAVYDADPEAQLFLSWIWLSKYIEKLSDPWFVLAVKSDDDGAYVAFFPLRLRTKMRRGGGFYNQINMVGNYAADYTGFICVPQFQDQAIPAFAKYIKKLNWADLNLENITASEERARLFMKHFAGEEFRAKEHERVNKRDNTNNLICPYLKLPGDWDSYLANNLSSNTRQKVKRHLRTVEKSDELRITHANEETFERDLKILLWFWKTKWTPRKGERIGTLIHSNRAMLTRSFESGLLYLPMLWLGERPLGGLASLIDERKKSLLFYLAGRDETFNNPPPGVILHAHSIRHVIGLGLTTYDFLRGNEPYKYQFGAEDRLIKCIIVSTRDGRNLGKRLDSRSLPAVLRHATELHQSGKLAEAEAGYRQILDVEPAHPKALYYLGQLMAGQGNHVAASRLFKELVAVQPDSHKAWFRLGRALQSRGQFSEAEAAFREVIKREPDFHAAHYNLGHVLFKLERFYDAVAAFDATLRLKPDSGEAKTGRAHAVRMLGKSLPKVRSRPVLSGLPKSRPGARPPAPSSSDMAPFARPKKVVPIKLPTASS